MVTREEGDGRGEGEEGRRGGGEERRGERSWSDNTTEEGKGWIAMAEEGVNDAKGIDVIHSSLPQNWNDL